MSAAAISLFITTFLAIWAALHAYVFWRLASIPWIQLHVSAHALGIIATILWLSYPVARTLVRYVHKAWPFEFLAATWMGIMFLLFTALLAADILTLGGLVFTPFLPSVRAGALLLALTLSFIALVQGLRPPVVSDYEIHLPGLPRERDGLTMVQVSDLHLGNLIGARWMKKLILRVNALKPDLIVAVGDVLDGEADGLRRILPLLQELRAPLGVYAVTGNHEFYVGQDRSVELLKEAGYNVLQDRWIEATPGLIIAGVDDIGTHPKGAVAAIQKALANRPPGATVFLCHTPADAEVAAAAGANLMLCGHTHEGQVWPFSYLVKKRFKLLAGLYRVQAMSVLVCRGTGTWGPRMRLWKPSEMMRIKLRSSQVGRVS